MNQVDGGMRYSATDLLTWHGCAHASRLYALAMRSERPAQLWSVAAVDSAVAR